MGGGGPPPRGQRSGTLTATGWCLGTAASAGGGTTSQARRRPSASNRGQLPPRSHSGPAAPARPWARRGRASAWPRGGRTLTNQKGGAASGRAPPAGLDGPRHGLRARRVALSRRPQDHHGLRCRRQRRRRRRRGHRGRSRGRRGHRRSRRRRAGGRVLVGRRAVVDAQLIVGLRFVDAQDRHLVVAVGPRAHRAAASAAGAGRTSHAEKGRPGSRRPR
jgi:hypothetical protein